MPKPRIFLDTDACSKLGGLEQEQQQHFWTVLETYVYAASPLTLVELLRRRHRGDDAHFEANGRPLVSLWGRRGPLFMRLPGSWLLLKALGIDRPHPSPDFEPADFKRWLRVAMAARTRRQLEIEGVEIPGRQDGERFGLAIDRTEREVIQGREGHRDRLDRVRRLTLNPLSHDVWAAALLQPLDADATPENVAEIVAVTGAAYQYDRVLQTLARTANYDFGRHASDWMDMQQLLYLADPLVHLMTDDRQLRERTLGSGQENRIILWSQFLQEHDVLR